MTTYLEGLKADVGLNHRNSSYNLYTYFACLFVCLFLYSINLKTAEPAEPNFCGTSHDTREGLWMVRI